MKQLGIGLGIATLLALTPARAASIAYRLGGDDALLSQYRDQPNSYPTCKAATDYLHFDGALQPWKSSLFKTNKALIEVGSYGTGASFNGSEVVKRIRNYEGSGWNVFGVFLYRENWLAGDVGGPYPQDRRILSQEELAKIRLAIATANPPLKCKSSVKLIQLMGGRVKGQRGDSWMSFSRSLKEYLKGFDGVGIECHIGDDNPVGDRQGTLKAMAEMAKWAQANRKAALVFMGGGPATYEDLSKAQLTYQYLWAQMTAAGVNPKADHIIYFRQAARAGKQTPENAPNTLTHQQKWVISELGRNPVK